MQKDLKHVKMTKKETKGGEKSGQQWHGTQVKTKLQEGKALPAMWKLLRHCPAVAV